MVSIQSVKATTTTTAAASSTSSATTSRSSPQVATKSTTQQHQHQHHSSSTSSSTSIPTTVLTRAVIPSLVTHLDASDVLECYYLTRQTVLSGSGSSGSGSSSGSMNNITITKAAIGLRQKNLPQQTAASSSRREKRMPLQLTLEFGASKDVSQISTTTTTTTGGAGAGDEGNNGDHGGGGGIVAESIPRVIWDEFTLPSPGENDNNQDNEQQQQQQKQRIPVTVTWENEGRVYFTTDPIGQGPYTTANYLASVSGAVLNHLLQAAVDYTTTRARFRRYQPFAVYQQQQPQEPEVTSEQQQQQQQQPPNQKTTTTTSPPQLKEVLRSSSDVDFIMYLYENLATLGVSLEPILLPQHTQMRLHVAAASSSPDDDNQDNNPDDSQQQQQQQKPWEFVQVGKDVSAHDVADFYAKLTSCVQALVAADTSVYAKKQPNQGKNTTNTTNTTQSKDPLTDNQSRGSIPPSLAPSNEPPRRRRRYHHNRRALIAAGENSTLSSTARPGWNKTAAISISNSLSTSRAGNITTTTATTKATTAQTIMPSSAPSIYSSSLIPTTEIDTQAPTTEVPTRSPTTAKSESEQAAQAAADAQEAANQAEEAGNKPAAEAAQAAADAAQRAADVTATQQALMHQKALLSGDAASMAATVALCFSDPAYGLAPAPSKALDNNKNNTNGGGKNATQGAAAATTTTAAPVPTTAYLYWDGIFYVKCDLVPPYISVAPLEYRLPQPKQAGTGITGDDFVDWSLALLIALMFAMGLLLLLQQVSGRNFKIIRPLYRFQRWFFDPTHYDLQAMDELSEPGAPWGMGREYTFGEDVIPLSMGGRRATTPTRSDSDNGHGRGIGSLFASSGSSKHYHHIRGKSNGDLEMVSRASSHTKLRSNTGGSSHHSLSSIDESERSFEEFAAGIEDAPPTRLFRDPDLVDLPDLTSTSKVAVPVSMVGRGSPSPPLDE